MIGGIDSHSLEKLSPPVLNASILRQLIRGQDSTSLADEYCEETGMFNEVDYTNTHLSIIIIIIVHYPFLSTYCITSLVSYFGFHFNFTLITIRKFVLINASCLFS